VTGSANGPLGADLFERGEVTPVGDIVTIIGEQGDVIGRKGRVTIRLTVQGTQVTAVQIGGRAVTVVEGELLID
jgi:PhzF family phenazine biosynthesis protein